MTQEQAQGAISRQIDEILDLIDRRVRERQQLSDRLQKSIDESKCNLPIERSFENARAAKPPAQPLL